MANPLSFLPAALLFAALWAQPAWGAEPAAERRPAAEPNLLQTVLKLTPRNTESLFCVDATFAITNRTDLTTTSPFETASYLTTVLSARLKGVAGFEISKARCAISAVREIELPKPDPKTRICSGLFRSKRCELILTADALPKDWPTRVQALSLPFLRSPATRSTRLLRVTRRFSSSSWAPTSCVFRTTRRFLRKCLSWPVQGSPRRSRVFPRFPSPRP